MCKKHAPIVSDLIKKYKNKGEWPQWSDINKLGPYDQYLVLRQIVKKEHCAAEVVILHYEIDGWLPAETVERLKKYAKKQKPPTDDDSIS